MESVIKFKKITAKKEHVCDLCGLHIHTNSKYFYRLIKGKSPGDIYEFKNHCCCESIMYYLYSVCFTGAMRMGKSEFDSACIQLLKEVVYPSKSLSSEQIEEKLSHYYEDKKSYLIDIINYMNEHDHMAVSYEEL